MISKLMLVLVFCISLLLVGCSKPDPMVGTWKMSLDDTLAKQLPKGMQMPTATLEFKADKTFTVTTVAAGKTSSMDGTYKLEGKSLTMTVANMEGKPAPEQMKKPETVTLSEDMKSFDMPGGMGKVVKQ